MIAQDSRPSEYVALLSVGGRCWCHVAWGRCRRFIVLTSFSEALRGSLSQVEVVKEKGEKACDEQVGWAKILKNCQTWE